MIRKVQALAIVGVSSLGLIFASEGRSQIADPPGPSMVAAVANAGLFKSNPEINSLSITVSDMDRAVDFYTRVLTFRMVADREVKGEEYDQLMHLSGARVRCVRLKLGEESIELQQFLTPLGRPIPIPSYSNDRWFQHIAVIVSSMPAAYALLQKSHVQYESNVPQRLPEWNHAAAGIQAFYFHDPDGHNIEVLSFPADKGEKRWHAHDRLFLGIDHSAIVVGNTDASVQFYRGRLGFKIVGTSENYGPEQEHLNNVFGAHLRITSLRPVHGPGVELLEYITPHTGRLLPTDTHPNDLWYWQINLRVADPKELEGLSPGGGSAAAEASDVKLRRDDVLQWKTSFLIHDPDGHAVLIGR